MSAMAFTVTPVSTTSSSVCIDPGQRHGRPYTYQVQRDWRGTHYQDMLFWSSSCLSAHGGRSNDINDEHECTADNNTPPVGVETKYNTVDDGKEENQNACAESSSFTDEEWKVLSVMHEEAMSSSSSLEQVVLAALPTLSPSTIVKLRSRDISHRSSGGWEADCVDTDTTSTILNDLAMALQSVLDDRLSQAKDLLQTLLGAGEIKKLDALIGKAARLQQLDVAFFQVLQANIQDATSREDKDTKSNATVGTNEGASNYDEPTSPSSAAPTGTTAFSNTRFQILQHIYTRCQEEVENTIAPGMALLNKLLRTEQPSIRQNQLQYYLCPRPNIITAPDGKQLVLGENNNKTLVEHLDFCNALGRAVQQIRTVQSVGGTSPDIAAHMVESCRQVAKEARLVLATQYGGVKSQQVVAFEEALQPIFRPESPMSPFITGEMDVI